VPNCGRVSRRFRPISILRERAAVWPSVDRKAGRGSNLSALWPGFLASVLAETGCDASDRCAWEV
jgi:hypothetical protein